MTTGHAGFSETGTTWIGHRRGTGGYTLIQLAMFIAGVATFAQLYAPQAVLPQIADGFGVSTAESALMISAGTLGLALAVVPWSLVADRIGRKRAMSIAIVAATLLAFVTLAMPNFEFAIIVRFFEGCALGGVPAVAMAYLNEEVHKKDAAAAVGTFIAGNTIGGLSGRIISGPLAEATGSWQFGVLAVAILSAIASVLFILLAPRPSGFQPLSQISIGESIATTLRNAWRHLHDPVLVSLYVQPFLLMGGFVAIYNYLGFHLSAPPFLLPVWVSSMVFLAYLAGSVSSPFAGRIAGRHGRKLVMIVCDLVAIASLLLMLIPNLWAIIVGLVLMTAAFFGSHSTASGWAGAWPTEGRAQSTALYNLLYYVGSSVFGYVGGVFYQQWGWDALVYLVAGLFGSGMLVGIIVLPRKPRAARS
ncbi:MFS transporter [Gulosibacter sediminis]|uniref:MFS transporter n=1 Tax=Gulosibacter sediminis TaxID=1729695 RepID=UPI0024A85944|nr:MFS transporter [Gulosibacter sediminis]